MYTKTSLSVYQKHIRADASVVSSIVPKFLHYTQQSLAIKKSNLAILATMNVIVGLLS